MALNGLIIAAPASGSGKTMITLGLLRALRNRDMAICSAKSGPDYIDPAFHTAASGTNCINLDAWAMEPDELRSMAHRQANGLLLIEGAMGLFDGAPAAGLPLGRGSVADLAITLELPVVLVVDIARQAQTVAAVVAGLAGFREGVKIAGVILNRVGSERHREMVTQALEAIGVPVLGAVMRDTRMERESRHLGLVQAVEDTGLDRFIEGAAKVVAEGVDLNALVAIATPLGQAGPMPALTPLGQSIAVAHDEAFAFIYPHILERWRAAGASVSFFSPLADEGPAAGADAVFLPGGYPELYAGKLAGNDRFKTAILASGAEIYGECGGYMVLGEGLEDADGNQHQMLGLLPVSTSFKARKLHLGYRTLTARSGPLKGHQIPAHEFHYASITGCDAPNLFEAKDSMGTPLGMIGHSIGRISGSFAHVIMPPHTS